MTFELTHNYLVQTACHVNVDRLHSNGVKNSGLYDHFDYVWQYSKQLKLVYNVHVHYKSPCDVTHITLPDIGYPRGALVVSSLTIFNEVIMPIINVVILY